MSRGLGIANDAELEKIRLILGRKITQNNDLLSIFITFIARLVFFGFWKVFGYLQRPFSYYKTIFEATNL